jgi:hypothetical protein
MTHLPRFLLAACLLIALSRCKFKNQLDNKLKSLPDTLFETYDRFLDAILPQDWVYVEAVLRWLMFSVRPILLQELSDAIAFDFSDPAEYIYDPSLREDTTSAISDWLEGMVTASVDYGETRVTLAHASVQDYLLSTHFMTKFRRDLSESLSHTLLPGHASAISCTSPTIPRTRRQVGPIHWRCMQPGIGVATCCVTKTGPSYLMGQCGYSRPGVNSTVH